MFFCESIIILEKLIDRYIHFKLNTKLDSYKKHNKTISSSVSSSFDQSKKDLPRARGRCP